jgi:acetyl-CoA acetyltransferase
MGGFYDVTLAVGAEQRKRCPPGRVGWPAPIITMKTGYGDFMFPSFRADRADLYRNTATEADLTGIMENYAHAKLNPLRKTATSHIRLRTRVWQNPRCSAAKVSDFSQITDGAASVVLVSGKYLIRSVAIGADRRLFLHGHATSCLPLDKKDAPTFDRAQSS